MSCDTNDYQNNDKELYEYQNMESIEQFDIGEECCPGPSTSNINQNEIWEDPSREMSLIMQDDRTIGRKRKRPGRRAQGTVVEIQRKQPERAARVKSFQKYAELSDEDLRNPLLEIEVDDEEGEEQIEDTATQTWRLFVRKDGSGMHFDWPIYSDNVINLNAVVSIISSNASIIPENYICTTIPQEYTNTGVFVVRLDEVLHKDELCNDGLGTWHPAQMFVKKYIVQKPSRRPLMTHKNDHNLKIVCEQFVHPGTDDRGDFIRRIYTGFDKDEHMIPYVVICYEWMGKAHPLTVYSNDNESEKNEHTMWKKCANKEQQVPILVKNSCDYNMAISILLSTDKFETYGKSVPMEVHESVSFALDIEACGGESAIAMDGNHWNKPSGKSRQYRVLYDGTEDPSSWKFERTNRDNFDIQVICRTYSGKESSYGLCRKIYVVRIKPSCPSHVIDCLVNAHLVVLSYSYKKVPSIPFYVDSASNVEYSEEAVRHQDSDLMLAKSNEAEEELTQDMRELVHKTDCMKKENFERIRMLMTRVKIMEKFVKMNGRDVTDLVREIARIASILNEAYHNYC